MKDGIDELVELVEELQELPGWPGVGVSAGLVVADLLGAVGWSDERIAALLGFDPRAYGETRPEPAE